jgi:hypothetical protein
MNTNPITEEILKQIAKEGLTKKEAMLTAKDLVIPNFYKLVLTNAKHRNESVAAEFRTDWSKLMSDIPQNKAQLQNIIKGLFGLYEGTDEGLLNLNTDKCPKDVSMIFANLTREQHRQFERLVLQPALGNGYMIKPIRGGSEDKITNRSAEDKVKAAVAECKKNNLKLVLVSTNMGSRSFSVSEIDTIFLMYDRGDINSTGQKTLRGVTPGNTYLNEVKTDCHIVSLSLDPNRTESPIDDWIIAEAEKTQGGDDLFKTVKTVLRSIHVFSNQNGVTQKIDTDEYAKELLTSSSLYSVAAASIRIDVIDNDDPAFRNVIVNKSKNTKQESATKKPIKRTYEGSDKGEQDEVVENIQRLKMEKIRSIIQQIPAFTQLNRYQSDNFKEMMIMIQNGPYVNWVHIEVGVHCEDILRWYEMGCFPQKLMNTLLSSYNSEKLKELKNSDF